MLPPLTEDEAERLLPAWARALRVARNRIEYKVGDRVYDVLYGPKHGMEPHGTVRGVSQQGEDQDGRGGEQGIHVVYDNGSEAGTLARYHVPLPPEHDPRAR